MGDRDRVTDSDTLYEGTCRRVVVTGRAENGFRTGVGKVPRKERKG